MTNYLERLPKEAKELIRLAARQAHRQKVSCYLVGGIVRDLVLGLPNLDLDIVVEGDGIKFAEELAEILKARLIRHRQFGTATLALGADFKIDFASARKEFYPKAASLPVVSPGSLRNDLLRRDFTINAMAIRLSTQTRTELIDFFHGEDDLKSKKIRVLHCASFIDDPTRILRAIRFEQRYNFTIEPATLRELKKAAGAGMLNRVGPQRLRDELILILKEAHPLKPLKRMKGLVGASFISQNLSLTNANFSFLSRLEKEIAWFKTRHILRRRLDAWLIYFIGIIDGLSLGEVRAICRNFVFRRGEEKRILDYKRLHYKIFSLLKQHVIKPSRIYRLLEPLSYEVMLAIKAKYKNENLQRRIEDFLAKHNGMRIFAKGSDLKALGLVPGPAYQKIFQKVLDARIDGEIKTRVEELRFINRITARK
jgi:tRNA nucleotidyltransferase (CCA-adding enzyme)